MTRKYEPPKFKLRLICVNCGMIGMYEIPVRRVFYDFRPEMFSPDGYRHDEEYSHYEFTNGRDWTPVICAQCNVPWLVKTPLNIGFGPVIAQDTSNVSN